MLALPFPFPDPASQFAIGPFHMGDAVIGIRWYALAYIAGLVAGWWYVRWIVRRPPQAMSLPQVDDFLVWATVGVVLGGRIGYVLFYKPLYYLGHPAEILMLWKGGMAFHGGALGVILALWLYSRRHKLSFFAIGDAVVCAVPIGLFFGRVANFINGELFGRPAPDFAWAMVFPHDPLQLPRHPSQLYQACFEGLALFILLHLLWRVPAIRQRPGTLAGFFLMGYGLARMVGELFREPDAHLGYLWGGATMGQLLSLPMVLVGLALALFAQRRAQAA